MKKIICSLIAVLLVIACMFSVNAAEYNGYGGGYNVGEGEITAYGHQYSKFTIEIPETVNTDGYNPISVDDADLESGYAVQVAVTNFNENHCITMTNTDDNNITADMQLSGNITNNEYPSIIAQFTQEDITDGSASCDLTATMDYDSHSGTYTGTVTYVVYCTTAIPYC